MEIKDIIIRIIIILEILFIILRIEYPLTPFAAVMIGLIVSLIPDTILIQVIEHHNYSQLEVIQIKIKTFTYQLITGVVSCTALQFTHLGVEYKIYFTLSFLLCTLAWLILYRVVAYRIKNMWRNP